MKFQLQISCNLSRRLVSCIVMCTQYNTQFSKGSPKLLRRLKFIKFYLTCSVAKHCTKETNITLHQFPDEFETPQKLGTPLRKLRVICCERTNESSDWLALMQLFLLRK